MARPGVVFTRADGSAWHPEYVSRQFEILVLQAGVPKIRFDDQCHTHASMTRVRRDARDAHRELSDGVA